MLISVGHARNPSKHTLNEYITIDIRATSVRHIRPLLHRSPLLNLIDPLLQSRELGEVNIEDPRTISSPREVGDIGNRALRTGEVGAFLQTGFQNRVEAPCLVDVSLRTVVGADIGEESEVICLA